MATTKTVQTVTFVWEGINKKGDKLSGETRGPSLALVKAELRRQGINPTSVKKKPKSLFGGKKKGKIAPRDIAVFSRQLAIMMSSGVPMIQAFEIIGRGHENAAMQSMILNIKADVEGGNTLTDSLAKFPLQFDSLYCNLVNAGEQAGILESLLDKIATYKEKTEALKAKIKKAMIYPAAIVSVALIVTTILLLFVIPEFQKMFASFGGELPALTQFVIDMSIFLQKWWIVVFGSMGGAVVVFIRTKRSSEEFRNKLDAMSLKVPVFGDLLNKAAIARFARTLSTMFAAGVPLVDAMETVAGTAGNYVYETAIRKMREEVATGSPIYQSMDHTKMFPAMVVQMVAIGEEAGSVDSMLAKVADMYEQEVDNAVDNLSTLMEPMIMAFLGVVIGGLVVAMYLPIFKMGQVV
ncbi:MAG: type II secretion system F family protein [Gammaproteobacteria bacterium]|nr:type II secretion system F family protein [Gammaproteobacteria bacterium]